MKRARPPKRGRTIKPKSKGHTVKTTLEKASKRYLAAFESGAPASVCKRRLLRMVEICNRSSRSFVKSRGHVVGNSTGKKISQDIRATKAGKFAKVQA